MRLKIAKLALVGCVVALVAVVTIALLTKHSGSLQGVERSEQKSSYGVNSSSGNEPREGDAAPTFRTLRQGAFK